MRNIWTRHDTTGYMVQEGHLATGKHDKNGVEIFEGDHIVNNILTNVFEVFWDHENTALRKRPLGDTNNNNASGLNNMEYWERLEASES